MIIDEFLLIGFGENKAFKKKSNGWEISENQNLEKCPSKPVFFNLEMNEIHKVIILLSLTQQPYLIYVLLEYLILSVKSDTS